MIVVYRFRGAVQALNQGEGAWPCRRPGAWRITAHKTLAAACGSPLRATAGAVTAKKTPRRTWLAVGRFFLRPARWSGDEAQLEDEKQSGDEAQSGHAAKNAHYRSRNTMTPAVRENDPPCADIVTRHPAIAVAYAPLYGWRGPQNGEHAGVVDMMSFAPFCGLRWENHKNENAVDCGRRVRI